MKSDRNELPPYGRLVAAALVAAGAVAMLINHFLSRPPTVGRLLLLCLGPMALMLGIGGLVEPKIMWSVGKYGKDLPLAYKLVGGALAMAGLLITVLLLFVYPLSPPS